MHKADLLLHPVRMRIMLALAGRELTTSQLHEQLHEIAQATLYRHIKLLYEHHILEIAAETQINGALERTYRITAGQAHLSPADAQGLSEADHLRYFTMFMASLVEQTATYLKHTAPEQILTAGFSYNQAVIHLSAQELIEFRTAITSLIESVMQQLPREDRATFTLASVVIPEPKEIV